MNNERPVIRVHKNTCSLCAGRMVRGGAAAMRTLHTAARRLLHAPLTVVTFLKNTPSQRVMHICLHKKGNKVSPLQGTVKNKSIGVY